MAARLMSVPGIGAICATALGSAGTASLRRSSKGRDFRCLAWPRPQTELVWQGRTRLGQCLEDGAARPAPPYWFIGATVRGPLGRPADGAPAGSWLARMLGAEAAECWWLSLWPTNWRASLGRIAGSAVSVYRAPAAAAPHSRRASGSRDVVGCGEV